jgi:hypothetical protein
MNLYDPDKLFPHPLNLAIYGHEPPDAELTASIRKKGVLTPVEVVTATINGATELYILSGHRRVAAAKEVGCKVPIHINLSLSPLQQEEFLLTANIQRVKTPEQKFREVRERERIELEKAAKRRAEGIREPVSALSRAATAVGVDDAWARRMKAVMQAVSEGNPIAIEGLAAINAGRETPDTICRQLYPREEKNDIVAHYEEVARKLRRSVGMFQVTYAPRPEEPQHGFVFKTRFICEEEAEAFIELFKAVPTEAMDKFVRASTSWHK